MRIAVIVSTKGLADMNIKACLLEQGFRETEEDFDGHKACILPGTEARLYTTDTDSVYCENIDRKVDADLFIFATRHSSEAGIKSLSVHAAGNWGSADFGGTERQLCIAPASYLKAALLKLDELIGAKSIRPTQPTSPPPTQSSQGLSEFSVIQECTHHGPYLEKPCMFIEIGSNENEWKNKEAGKVIAETIIYLIKNKPKLCKTIFGIGGLHHTPEFSKIARRTDFAVGHVCPKYNLENLDEEMIKQALEKNIEEDVIVVLDWKGLKTEKEKVVNLLEKMNIDFKKTKELT